MTVLYSARFIRGKCQTFSCLGQWHMNIWSRHGLISCISCREGLSTNQHQTWHQPWRLAYGPLTRYVKLRVAHAPGIPETFSPPPRDSDPVMHHGTRVTHVSWCMPGLPTSGYLRSRWREKRSRHSRRMRNPQFWVSGKRPMVPETFGIALVHTRYPYTVCTFVG